MGRVEEDMYFAGVATFKTMVPNAGAISKAHVAAAAGIEASKLQHQYERIVSQPNTTATTETRIIHEVYGATAQVLGFRAGSIAANVGAATVTVDLRKNGTTILTAVITLNASSVAYVSQAATVTSPNLVTGDVLTVVITATVGGGTLATGVWCQVVLTEDAV